MENRFWGPGILHEVLRTGLQVSLYFRSYMYVCISVDMRLSIDRCVPLGLGVWGMHAGLKGFLKEKAPRNLVSGVPLSTAILA